MSCQYTSVCKKFRESLCKGDEDFCIKRFKLDYFFDAAQVTNSQRNKVSLRIDADGADRDAFMWLKSVETNIEEFVDNGQMIYIFSKHCGNGKTLWALRLLQSYINSTWYKSELSCKCLFIHVPKFLLELKRNIEEKSEYVSNIMDGLRTARLVVWDEIGTKSVTTFEHEHLLSLINSCIDNGVAQIFTSNLSPKELKESWGERLYSRVVNLSKVLEFVGKDKRGIK